jgi:hypothetical protein
MINSLPVPARKSLEGAEGADANSEDARELSAFHHGSDCPWIACDPQLRAAPAADHPRSMQRDQTEDDPLHADEHARIAAEIIWLVRRGGEPPSPPGLASG